MIILKKIFSFLARVVLPRITIVGIDIQDKHMVSIAVMRKGISVQTLNAITHQVPEEAIENGIMRQPAVLRGVIEAILRALPSRFGSSPDPIFVLSVPPHHLYTETIFLPPMNKHDLTEAVQLKIENALPWPTNETYVDWQVFETPHPEKIGVFIAAIEKSALDSYLQVFMENDFKIGACEFHLVSLSRFLTAQATKPFIFILIDEDGIEFSIFFNNTLIAHHHHPLSNSTSSTGLTLSSNSFDTTPSTPLRTSQDKSGQVPSIPRPDSLLSQNVSPSSETTDGRNMTSAALPSQNATAGTAGQMGQANSLEAEQTKTDNITSILETKVRQLMNYAEENLGLSAEQIFVLNTAQYQSAQEVIQNVSGISVQVFGPPLNFDPKTLIAHGAALRPYESTDASINLVPSELGGRYRENLFLKIVDFWTDIFFAYALIVLIVLASTFLFFRTQYQTIHQNDKLTAATDNMAITPETKTLIEEASSFNTLGATFKKDALTRRKIGERLKIILQEARYSGLTFQNARSVERGVITASFLAPTRDVALSFVHSLEQAGFVATIPLDQLAGEKNIQLSMNIKY